MNGYVCAVAQGGRLHGKKPMNGSSLAESTAALVEAEDRLDGGSWACGSGRRWPRLLCLGGHVGGLAAHANRLGLISRPVHIHKLVLQHPRQQLVSCGVGRRTDQDARPPDLLLLRRPRHGCRHRVAAAVRWSAGSQAGSLLRGRSCRCCRRRRGCGRLGARACAGFEPAVVGEVVELIVAEVPRVED